LGGRAANALFAGPVHRNMLITIIRLGKYGAFSASRAMAPWDISRRTENGFPVPLPTWGRRKRPNEMEKWNGKKRCPDCGETKSLEEFPRNRSAGGGRGTYCSRNRENVKRLYGNSRHYHMRQKYGLGALEIEEIVRHQGGYCPVCLTRPAVHVDHDHSTGKIRGVLCLGCNTGLGLFRDKLEWIARAIEYLGEAHQGI
jgi:hypothetical protein